MTKKLVNLRCYVAIGKNDYCDTSFHDHIRYIEVDNCDTQEYTLNSWEETFAEVGNDKIRNANIHRTLFRNRPVIEFHWSSFSESCTRLTEKNFKPVRVKWQCEKVDSSYSMKDLADLLPAEQFCEWLKDQGITMIGSM